MSRQVCIQVGKAIGSCIRSVGETVKKAGRIGEVITSCKEKMLNATKTAVTKVKNLFKRVSKDGQLAALEEKEKVMFTEFGEKVFRSIESKVENVFEQEDVKNILAQLREHEKKIQSIKEEIDLQRRRMEEMAIFRRAAKDIENKDPRVRRVAIRVLERLETKDAIPLLTKALEDPDPEVRERASAVLHKLINKIKTTSTQYSQIEEEKTGQ